MASSQRRPITDAERWFRERYARTPERDALFTTLTGEPVEPLYGPEDVGPFDERIGFPGEFPFTRGVYPSMYRGPAVDDAPVRRLRHGRGDQRALPLPARPRPDRPVDGVRHAVADGPRLRPPALARARSGREGVAIDTLDDMETLFGGIDMGEVSTSMTINAPAAVMLAFYVVAAERQGVGPERLAGTIQTDILKEYIAQKEWCFPIDPAMRLVTDMVEFCAGACRAGTRSRSPATTSARPARRPQQELAFTLKDGFTYVEQAIERGLDVDDFAPRL